VIERASAAEPSAALATAPMPAVSDSGAGRLLRLEGFAYRHESVRSPRPFSRLEKLLAAGQLATRIDDAFYRERRAPGRSGIYVNYAPPVTARRRQASGHLALATDPTRADIGVCAPDDDLHALLVDELEVKLGLPADRRSLRVLRVPAP